MKKLRLIYAKWQEYKQSLKASNKYKYYFAAFIEDITVAFILALIVKTFAFQSSMVYSGSMIPTMKINDFLIVNKLVYKFREPVRGEIVLFKSPYKDKKAFVKRLVGLAGDKIEIKQGIVYVNDEQLVFPGIDIQSDYSFFAPIEVPKDSYFFLGDNRKYSADSRYWGFIKSKDLVGKAWFTFWPLNHMQVLR
jgi:signal peptidase I